MLVPCCSVRQPFGCASLVNPPLLPVLPMMFGPTKHNRLLVCSRARVGDPRFERSVPRHRLGCDGGRRSCDRGNHGGARLFGDAIELALWRCVNRATRRSSIPSLHQSLMHGRSLREFGCTPLDLPKIELDLVASKTMPYAYDQSPQTLEFEVLFDL